MQSKMDIVIQEAQKTLQTPAISSSKSNLVQLMSSKNSRTIPTIIFANLCRDAACSV